MYAYVHIEKTGGTTLHSILRRSFGARHCDVRLPLAKRADDHRDFRPCVDAADLRRARRFYRDLRGISGHNIRAYSDLAAECPEIQCFTYLREPIARYRSHFLNRSVDYGRADFDRWMADSRLHNWQTKIIAGEPSAEKAIELIASRFGFVGLTERFDESLILLGAWLREQAFRPEYRRLNQLADKRRPQDVAREKTDIRYLESGEVRAQMLEANREDLKLYDHLTRTVYPRETAAYEGDLEADVQALRERNRANEPLREPAWGIFKRNYVYKPLLHLHLG